VGTGKTCLPYPFPGCAHHVEPTEDVPACPTEDYETPRCRITCSEAAYEGAYLADKHKAKRAYSLRRSVEAIQLEIMEEGPVTAAFTVYQVTDWSDWLNGLID
jgi:cathepsin B